MLRIGITGGIGSGKTMVCAIFATLGVSIYNSDERAKLVMTENNSLKKALKKAFGEDTYFENGQLNRKLLSALVFNDKEKLNTLNSIVHPVVFEDMIKWYAEHENHEYVIQESAIMFESGSYKMLDKIILVFAEKEIRVERVIKRDSISRVEVEARMSKQMPEEEKIKLADYIIYNSGNDSLIEQTMALHNKILELIKR